MFDPGIQKLWPKKIVFAMFAMDFYPLGSCNNYLPLSTIYTGWSNKKFINRSRGEVFEKF